MLHEEAYDYYIQTRLGITKIPFFIFGVYAGKLSMQGKKMSVLWLVALVILLCGSYMISFEEVVIVRESLRRLLGIPLCCLLFLFIYRCRQIISLLQILGKYSLEIYIMHLLFRGIFCDYVSDIWIAASLPILASLVAAKPVHFICTRIVSCINEC